MANRRDMLVRAALVAAVTASVGLFAASGEAPELPAAVAVPAPVSVQRPPAKSETLRIDLLQRRAQERAARDVFAAHSWQPPPPPPAQPKLEPPPPPPPPDPPAAPPLPFTFLGAFESAGGKQVFYLVEGDRVHAVSAGETLSELYSIEAVDADGMVLVYLPLKIRQTLAFEGKK
jgi:hypothetical protein